MNKLSEMISRFARPKAATSPAINQQKCYAMALNKDNEAEITMYGEIVKERPYDFWTGEPVDGSFIIQSEFLDDLESIVKSGTKKIKIRMDSVGGDCGVSILIHNRLRELSRNGVEVTCIVDGVAMSGGSLIMCACDNVQVNPSSLVMIHKCWSFLIGGYNADELRAEATSNDSYDAAQVSIYQRKTKLSETVIRHMMSDTTYMTGTEAVEKGFADSLIEDAEPLSIAASADRTSLLVRGKTLRLARGMTIPESIPTVGTAPKDNAETINSNLPETNTGSEGGSLMATNLTELRTENPTLASSIEAEVRAAVLAENDNTAAVNAAVASERARLQAIDEIAANVDSEMLAEAKYGKTACSAQELAFRAMKQQANAGTEFLKGLNQDYKDSNAGKVPAVNPIDDKKPNTPEEKSAAAKDDIKSLLGKETK